MDFSPKRFLYFICLSLFYRFFSLLFYTAGLSWDFHAFTVPDIAFLKKKLSIKNHSLLNASKVTINITLKCQSNPTIHWKLGSKFNNYLTGS